jgi:hypothetical protein
MPLVPRSVLKSFFITGAKPTSKQFNTLIDSVVNLTDDHQLLGLNNYDTTFIYSVGDCVVHNQILYQANTTTIPGPFNVIQWDRLSGGTPGSVLYNGTWNADTNVPNLNTIATTTGDYYVVSVAGNTILNSGANAISDWQVGDWAIYNGTLWQKIDNTDAVTDAANSATLGAGVYKGKNGTVLEFKKLYNLDGTINVNDGTDSITLGANFDDIGTSAATLWSAAKIITELATKEIANPNIQAHIANVTTNPHNVTKVQVGLGNVENTKVNFAGVSNPSITNDTDEGYTIGSTWINTVTATEFICMNAAAGAAVWQSVTPNPNIQAHIDNVTTNPHNVTKTNVGLGNVQNTKVNFTAVTNPSVTNDIEEDYSVGSIWINTLTATEYICMNAAAGAAVWQAITANPNIQAHIDNVTTNPHNVTKTNVGLSDVDNTSDVNKPVSTAQAAADAAVLTSANAFAETLVVGLLNDRGNYDASTNLFPSTGGSGTGGAIKKGDLWTINAPGTLGTQPVEIGDLVRALQNAPAQAVNKWAITQNNIGYVPENVANKTTVFSPVPANVLYPTEKLVADQLALKQGLLGFTPENVVNKVTAFSATPGNIFYPTEKLVADQLALKQELLGFTPENVVNKVTAFSATPGNIFYPTEKLVADQLALKQGLLGFIPENVVNKVTAFSAIPDDTRYPSEKLVADKFATFSNVRNIKTMVDSNVDPTITNDSSQGYSAGSTWINILLRRQFVCVNATIGAAVWKELTSLFGNDYQQLLPTVVTATPPTIAAGSGITVGYVPVSVDLNIAPGVLITGAKYRISWSLITSGTGNTRMLECKLVDSVATATVIGQTLGLKIVPATPVGEIITANGFGVYTASDSAARRFQVQVRIAPNAALLTTFTFTGNLQMEIYRVQ